MGGSNWFWETLSRVRVALWAIGEIWKVIALISVVIVGVFGYLQNVPVSYLIPAAILTLAGVLWLALGIQSAVARWVSRQPTSSLSARTKLLCALKEEAKCVRDAVISRPNSDLNIDDLAFQRIFMEFPGKVRMYAGADSERDYARLVGEATSDSKNIKIAAETAFAAIEQMAAVAVQHEQDQAAVSTKTL